MNEFVRNTRTGEVLTVEILEDAFLMVEFGGWLWRDVKTIRSLPACWCEMVNGRRHHADGCPTHEEIA